jgi:hypothetical protein
MAIGGRFQELRSSGCRIFVVVRLALNSSAQGLAFSSGTAKCLSV